MAYTEFYCKPTASGASNLNAGSAEDVPVASLAGGAWDATTTPANPVFTATGSPDLSAVTVGMFASVYPSGATITPFVARITAVDNVAKTITVSGTVKSGTAPANGTVTCTVGGAWAGPSGSVGFPFGFAGAAMTDAAQDPVRINLHDATTYSVSAAMVHNVAGPVSFQGYATTPGDGGRATIDGGTTTSPAYALLTVSGASVRLADLILAHDGTGVLTTGTGLLAISGASFRGTRITVRNSQGIGIYVTASNSTLIECEAADCAGSTSFAAIVIGTSPNQVTTLIRCTAHDTTAGAGFYALSGTVLMDGCIADNNAGDAFIWATVSGLTLLRCTATNNGRDGLRITAAAGSVGGHVESCAFVGNVGAGIDALPAAPAGPIQVVACGAYGNTGGDIVTSGGGAGAVQYLTSHAADLIAFPSNPFTGLGTSTVGGTRAGDFTPTPAAAKGAGRGTFPLSVNYSSTAAGHPDIGAAQHAETPGGGVSRSRIVGGV